MISSYVSRLFCCGKYFAYLLKTTTLDSVSNPISIFKFFKGGKYIKNSRLLTPLYLELTCDLNGYLKGTGIFFYYKLIGMLIGSLPSNTTQQATTGFLVFCLPYANAYFSWSIPQPTETPNIKSL